jgi:hypothetical protein
LGFASAYSADARPRVPPITPTASAYQRRTTLPQNSLRLTSTSRTTRFYGGNGMCNRNTHRIVIGAE